MRSFTRCAQGRAISAIARHVDLDRKTVRAYLASERGDGQAYRIPVYNSLMPVYLASEREVRGRSSGVFEALWAKLPAEGGFLTPSVISGSRCWG